MGLALPAKAWQALLLLSVSALGTLLPLAFVKRLESRADKGEECHAGEACDDGRLRQGSRAESRASDQGASRMELLALVLSCGNAFAGGVMLATGLVHMLSDALELSLTYRIGNTSEKGALFLPLAFCLGGILVPFFLEKSGLTLWLLQHQACFTDHYADMHGKEHETLAQDESEALLVRAKSDTGVVVNGISSFGTCGTSYDTLPIYSASGSSPLVSPSRPPSTPPDTFDYQHHHSMCASKCVVPSFSSTRIQGRLDLYRTLGSRSSILAAPLVYSATTVHPGSLLNPTHPKLLSAHSAQGLLLEHPDRHERDDQFARELGRVGLATVVAREREREREHGLVGTDSSILKSSPEQTARQLGVSSRTSRRSSDAGEAPPSRKSSLHSHGHESARKQEKTRENGPESEHHHPEKHSHMNFATFLMFLVLSIHSLIVGFSIGTIQDGGTSQHSAYLAVALHKIFESVALGTNAAQHPLTATVKGELAVYILAAPLGIVGGTVAMQYGSINAGAEAPVLGLAAGSFIYIALVEILADEFENEEYRIAKFVFFAAGTVVMAYLASAD